ncbi:MULTISPECIES: flotillin family protein [Lachnospiraceae]|uniref:flotillin family protein n=1 Tax=Lachnospiraceae TaxID=186803 RepID=UPI000E4503B3|nr:SPFH domain-containing protein [Hungatella hathewayi]RGO65942.1 flotillin family protein [Hungatella hathewayi]
MIELILKFAPAIVVIVLLAIIMLLGYVKAPPDTAYVISGLRKEPKILIGRSGLKWPFLEQKDALILKQISIDIKTNGYIPTQDFIGVDIDAIAKIRVRTDPEGMKLAMKNFLNMKEKDIVNSLTDSLQGNMREIIGTQKLKELCTDRKTFGDEVQKKAQFDMNALGIEIISCNIQKIEDEKGLIIALGQDNMSQIQKDASIAKAQAERDVAIAEADAQKIANEARVAAETEIAQKNNELAIKKAELQKASDTKKAEADAAYEIQRQEQEKTIQAATVNAQIAKAEREAELNKQQVLVVQQRLEAEINKKADADRYAIEQQAAAELTRRQRDAEAKKYEQEKEAEARKAQAEAEKFAMIQEAEGVKAKGEAEAAAIQAKGLAEAEAMEKKAEAMKKYGQAAMMEMIVQALPEMAKAIAEPLATIDKVTIIDSGKGDSGVSSMGDYVPSVLAKTIESIKETTGLDIVDVMKANTYDAKVTRNVNISGLPENDGENDAVNAAVAAIAKDVLDEMKE